MSTVPIGLAPPLLTAVPGSFAPWERTAGTAELVRVVETADLIGLDHVTCSEHVAVPTDVAGERGGTYWDPLAALSYLAALTSTVRLVPHVLVLGYHHPLALAKRWGTLDRLSGGRVVLGVGVGSAEREFALLGAPFSDRGARADDALPALRAALSSRTPTYAGPYYAFDDVVLDPTPVQQRVPFWIGGRTARSLRRAVAFGEGWTPFALRPDDVARLLSEVELPAGFDVVLGTGALDPLAEPERARDRLGRLQQAGATRVTASVKSSSPEHLCDQLHALVAL